MGEQEYCKGGSGICGGNAAAGGPGGPALPLRILEIPAKVLFKIKGRLSTRNSQH